MGVRVGLAIWPFRTIERETQRLMGGSKRSARHPAPQERLTWAVQSVSRYVPGVRCLAQAIVLKALLQRHGYPACIQMGFGKDGDANFKGHAWVECQGQVLLGGGP
jgi:Transglutaminase-like superfamily